MSKTGDKILSFGAKPFLQADLIGGMKENVHLQNKIAENLKNIDSEELETAFGKRSKIPAPVLVLNSWSTVPTECIMYLSVIAAPFTVAPILKP